MKESWTARPKIVRFFREIGSFPGFPDLAVGDESDDLILK